MDKQRIRESVWDALEREELARFPFPPQGRIPNFAGADEAADRLSETAVWQEADILKANPDSPQRPVRRAALAAGKVLYMASPRLREERCFIRLDPADIDDIAHATTIGGSDELGVRVLPEEVPSIDLIVTGCVAVDQRGGRIGKGEGYSDLEYAMLREFDLVCEDTPVATTVHGIQVLEEAIDAEPHDVRVSLVATPEAVIETDGPTDQPRGIDWSLLDAEDLDAMPVLRRLRGNASP